jgi:tRNA (mo5U34)-methyltransferase
MMRTPARGDAIPDPAPAAEAADVQTQIRRLGPWFHNLHLPDGTQTCPDHFLGDFPGYKWQVIADAIPADLSGWSILDVGCNAGFYSIELARRGGRVMAIDHDDRYLSQANWAVRQFGLEERITFRHMQVYDLAREEQSFDLVLFMGVFYHLRYPLLGLDIVAERVNRMMVFQTLTMPGDEVLDPGTDRDINDRGDMIQPGWPKMAFIEHRLAKDPTNWWAANHACVEAMLRSTGMVVERRLDQEICLCRPRKPSLAAARGWDRREFLAATGQDWAEGA